MNSKYHLMEYNKRKYRDQVSWVMQKRLTCSSTQYSASPEKILGSTSIHHLLQTVKKICLLAWGLITFIYFFSFSAYYWLSKYPVFSFRQLNEFLVSEFVLPLNSCKATEKSLVRLFRSSCFFQNYFQQFLKINQNCDSFKRKWDL